MLYTIDSNLYEVLGVAENETFVNIGKAYKALAKVWHPDKRPTAEKGEATRVFEIKRVGSKDFDRLRCLHMYLLSPLYC
jgi:curved DNA-binding protein CbpA